MLGTARRQDRAGSQISDLFAQAHKASKFMASRCSALSPVQNMPHANENELADPLLGRACDVCLSEPFLADLL